MSSPKRRCAWACVPMAPKKKNNRNRYVEKTRKLAVTNRLFQDETVGFKCGIDMDVSQACTYNFNFKMEPRQQRTQCLDIIKSIPTRMIVVIRDAGCSDTTYIKATRLAETESFVTVVNLTCNTIQEKAHNSLGVVTASVLTSSVNPIFVLKSVTLPALKTVPVLVEEHIQRNLNYETLDSGHSSFFIASKQKHSNGSLWLTNYTAQDVLLEKGHIVGYFYTTQKHSEIKVI
ncbi:ORF67-like protein [Bufonid herpesvirus 1]|uniref:ORF67-like protein n=1 Tax=Bufonid herpesvirus 1 TaxID=2282206 RepID=UPI000EB76216|nr:ORF67-like protein [Bufonid herpesvirus 1]AXF48644.1 ORF67-like protein [Bufonid herpesvirus 1]